MIILAVIFLYVKWLTVIICAIIVTHIPHWAVLRGFKMLTEENKAKIADIEQAVKDDCSATSEEVLFLIQHCRNLNDELERVYKDVY